MNEPFGLDPASVVLTVIVTITVGWLFYFLGTRHRRLGEMTCYEEQNTSLYKSLLNTFPDLEIMYKGKATTDHFYFYDCILQNTGSKDLVNTSGEVSITVPLSDEIIAWEILKSSDEVQPSLQGSGEDLTFSWHLLRSGEFIRFQLVARAAEPVDLKHMGKAVVFRHRIAETKNVRHESSVRAADKRRRRPTVWLLPLIWLAAIVTLSAIIYFAPQKYNPAVRNLETGESYRTYVRENGTVYYENTAGTEVEVENKPEAGYETTAIPVDNRFTTYFIFGQMVIMGALILPDMFKFRRRIKQLKEALAEPV